MNKPTKEAAVYRVRPGILALAAVLESMVRDHEKDIGAPEGKDDAGWLCERLRDEATRAIDSVTKQMKAEDEDLFAPLTEREEQELKDDERERRHDASLEEAEEKADD